MKVSFPPYLRQIRRDAQKTRREEKIRKAKEKHYWLTPPDPMEALNQEFNFDFDPCPFPRPEGFDGLTAEWGQSNYVNPPFKNSTPSAWARKAIAENKKGKRVVMVFPPWGHWVSMLLEAGATIRNLGNVKWLATEDRMPGTGMGRDIIAFILEPPRTTSVCSMSIAKTVSEKEKAIYRALVDELRAAAK